MEDATVLHQTEPNGLPLIVEELPPITDQKEPEKSGQASTQHPEWHGIHAFRAMASTLVDASDSPVGASEGAGIVTEQSHQPAQASFDSVALAKPNTPEVHLIEPPFLSTAPHSAHPLWTHAPLMQVDFSASPKSRPAIMPRTKVPPVKTPWGQHREPDATLTPQRIDSLPSEVYATPSSGVHSSIPQPMRRNKRTNLDHSPFQVTTANQKTTLEEDSSYSPKGAQATAPLSIQTTDPNNVPLATLLTANVLVQNPMATHLEKSPTGRRYITRRVTFKSTTSPKPTKSNSQTASHGKTKGKEKWTNPFKEKTAPTSIPSVPAGSQPQPNRSHLYINKPIANSAPIPAIVPPILPVVTQQQTLKSTKSSAPAQHKSGNFIDRTFAFLKRVLGQGDAILFQQKRRKGIEQTERGRYWSAEPLLRDALALVPRDLDCLLHLGFCLYKTGRVRESITVLQLAAKRDPFEPRLCSILGLALMDTHQYHAVIILLQEVAKRHTDRFHLNFQLGLAYQKCAQHDLSILALRTALTVRPDHSGACRALQAALLLQQSYKH
ncbi:MAG: tetratricopeptide repeat protein [Magnetococcus sp. DMHC-6]